CVARARELVVKRLCERHLEHVMRERLKKSLSLSNLASEMIEVQSLLRESPRKVSDILSLLAENKLQVRMTGLEESHLMESLQKIANRIAAGLVTAALIMASSLMMRVESEHRLFGYPAIALLLFLVGAGLGIAIVLSALLGDRKARPHEERGPRVSSTGGKYPMATSRSAWICSTGLVFVLVGIALAIGGGWLIARGG